MPSQEGGGVLLIFDLIKTMILFVPAPTASYDFPSLPHTEKDAP